MATVSSTNCKTKVVFILGATATGKSKLAISLAVRCNGEIINSDKIQVYDAIPVITNRVSEAEMSTAPHHLLAFVPPDAEYRAADFIRDCIDAISVISARRRVPIIAGGSNSYIKALVEHPDFSTAHEPCFIWLDSSEPDILDRFVSARVDSMVQQGLVEEARSLFDPENSDYTKGVKRAIGVKEMDAYFRSLSAGSDKATLSTMLESGVNAVKQNTCKLVQHQVEKIRRLRELNRGRFYRVDVSDVIASKMSATSSPEEDDQLWEEVIAAPCHEAVKEFLDVDFKSQFGAKSTVNLTNFLGCKETVAARILA